MACRLPNLFRHLYINGRSLSTSSHQTVNQARISPNAVSSFLKLSNSTSSSIYEPSFTLSSRSIDFGFTIPPPDISRISIIDAPVSINTHIEEPRKIIHNKEDVVPDKSIDLPSLDNITEKHAVRMIIIRKHKMKVHKLKKLRKRMKYTYRKLSQRRKLKKEKLFRKHIFTLISHAENFNAKKYVKERLSIIRTEVLPTRWRGEILPQKMIKEFLMEHRRKKEAKKNRKRLTL